jgi:hypothetical protein
MAFTAATVMQRASTILQDAEAVRWTAMELRDWLNEAVRAITTIKPDAATQSVIINLAVGTRQTLPEEYTILSKVVRNIGAAPGNAPGSAIRVLAKREILDAQIPNWHSNTGMPYSTDVNMVFQDAMNLREFYVIPGNSGSGRVEAIVGVRPVDVRMPAGNVMDVASYSGTVGLDDIYQGIILDFILFRAFAKDSAAADAAQRSQVHLQLASNALAALAGGRAAMSLAATYGGPAVTGAPVTAG